MSSRAASIEEALALAEGRPVERELDEITAADVARLEALAQPGSALDELQRYSLRRLLAGAIARGEGR